MSEANDKNTDRTTQRTGWPPELFLENLRHAGEEAHGLFAAYIHDAADEIELLREDNWIMASHIQGWTPDLNTQTAEDVAATEAIIRATVERAVRRSGGVKPA